MEWTGPITLLAPLVAIAFSLATKKVVPSLALGALVASFVVVQGAPVAAVVQTFDFLWAAIADWDHFMVTAFTLAVAMTMGVMTVSGALLDMVGLVQRVAKGRKGTMLATWFGGLLVFFDDYANCLVVGNTMGPVADRNGVSRAKLAYIVDSTAAPIASLTIVSTWVGYEVGLISDALGGAGHEGQAFTVFLEALGYRFYCIGAIILVGIVAFTGRDIGPMVQAERDAVASASDEEPNRGRFGAITPIVLLVLATFVAMVTDGLANTDGPAKVIDVLGNADPFQAMFRGSLVGLGAAVVQALMRKKGAAVIGTGMWRSAVQVLHALLVLYLAWTLGDGIRTSGAAEYLTSMLGGNLPAFWLPIATFLLALPIAFATGTSFGTMAILIPLAVPLALAIDPGNAILLAATTAAVLDGAVMGDHASPISDTTVLSSTGAGVDVVEHVRTQLPYAILGGGAALFVGYAPAMAGLPWWACIGLMGAALWLFMRVMGKNPTEVSAAA